MGALTPTTRLWRLVRRQHGDVTHEQLRGFRYSDGLRYHRTPQQQVRDRLRDQAHAAAKVPYVRFTHDQIAHDPRHVEATLLAAAR
jgi:hypothetical protein